MTATVFLNSKLHFFRSELIVEQHENSHNGAHLIHAL